MNFPRELKYTKSHEWVNYINDTTALIGLTDYAQKELGDLVYVNLPEEGDAIAKEEVVSDVESVKAVSDVYSPLSGVVKKINEELLDEPQRINETPYDAWLVEIADITSSEDLMDADAYERYVEEESA